MRDSLFSSLKVVAMMLAADSVPHPREKKWLLQIARNYGASFGEVAILAEILSGKSNELLSEVLSHVEDEFDKRRLLNFLQIAMRQDGLVKNSEIKLFYEIQKELETNLRNDYVKLGREIRKRDGEVRAWNELDRLGKALNVRVHGFPFSAHFFYADPELFTLLFDLVGKHWRKLMVVVFGLFVSYVLLFR
ncbi:hypothetical protein [Bdellovibrio sp. HCB274]|uniref:hypothetical protein n=1 Tax=Bdellovibrio sp. HCB274 TaxID=3394361 RepID=UPI0039B47EAD